MGKTVQGYYSYSQMKYSRMYRVVVRQTLVLLEERTEAISDHEYNMGISVAEEDYTMAFFSLTRWFVRYNPKVLRRERRSGVRSYSMSSDVRDHN